MLQMCASLTNKAFTIFFSKKSNCKHKQYVRTKLAHRYNKENVTTMNYTLSVWHSDTFMAKQTGMTRPFYLTLWRSRFKWFVLNTVHRTIEVGAHPHLKHRVILRVSKYCMFNCTTVNNTHYILWWLKDLLTMLCCALSCWQFPHTSD